MNERNSHHVMFPRVIHTSMEPAKQLRKIEWLKPPLDRFTHDQLHRKVPFVPILDYQTMQRVEKLYEPFRDDYVRSVEALAETIGQVIGSPNVPLVTRQVGGMMAYALRIQVPYIAEGLEL